MKRLACFAIAAALALSGCASVGGVVSKVVVAATTKTPNQATTVAEATQAATLIENSVKLYVDTANPSKAVLTQLQSLLAGLHQNLQRAQAADRAGNSALAASALDAFNQALAAYQTYAVNQGVSA